MQTMGWVRCGFATGLMALSCAPRHSADPKPVTGEILVKLRRAGEPPARLPSNSKTTVIATTVRSGDEGGPLLRWPISSELDPADVAQSAAQDPAVEYAEPVYRYSSFLHPSDPKYKDQWALKTINAEQAWSVTTGSKDVVVAIVDSGIDLKHADLKANIWRNPGEVAGNGSDDDGNGYVDDVNGWDFVGDTNDPSPKGEDSPETWHGSHVAGTIGAVGNNKKGITGVAWKAQLMAVRAIGPGGGRADQLAAGIDYAVDNGARIINASWGGSSRSETIARAIARAGRSGVLFVAAAGNDSAEGAGFPANLTNRNIISVGASAPDDSLADFSNRGSGVMVAAPGVSILSTTAPGRYELLDGTSMAAPHVSGLAALLLADDSTLSVKALRDSIFNGCTRPPALVETRYGRIDAGQSLSLVKGVSVNASKLLASRNAISLRAAPGGKSRSSSLKLRGEDGSAVKWTAASDQPWLALSATEGVTPSQLTISADASAFAQGTQQAIITISDGSGATTISTALEVGEVPRLAIAATGGCALQGTILDAKAGKPCALSVDGNEEAHARWDIDGQVVLGKSVLLSLVPDARTISLRVGLEKLDVQVRVSP